MPDLREELKRLRKGPGLTKERLSETSLVLDHLGGRSLPLEVLLERFVTLLENLRGTRNGDALWAAYAPDSGGNNELHQRRESYGRQIGLSPYQLRVLENRAIEVLVARLLTPRIQVPHAEVVIKDLHIVCLNRDRQFVEHRQTRTIISLIDGKETFEYHTYTPTELSHVTGGELEPSEPRGGGTVHRIRFPEPLGRGEPHTFGFRERIPEWHRPLEPTTNQDFSGQTFESPALRYRPEVHFLTDRPEVVWAYDKLSRIVRPGEPEEGVIIHLDETGIAKRVFRDLHGGLASGIAWRWDKAAGS